MSEWETEKPAESQEGEEESGGMGGGSEGEESGGGMGGGSEEESGSEGP